MGNIPYILMVAAVLLFGLLMPQKGSRRIYYIILMTVLHTCLCGFRWQFLTGDLHKYYWNFFVCGGYDWFSPELWAEGRNFGFLYFNKIIYTLFGEEQQVLLFSIALIVHVALAIVVYRYSPAPWFSYLIWNCMGIYLFGFSAIKQALAMAFVMLSFIGIAKRRVGFYLVMMAIAGAVHMPALVFLPAYWLAGSKVKPSTVLMYIVIGVVIYIFKNQFVKFITSFYYEDDEVFIYSGEIGNRMIMILGFTVFGILFRGYSNPVFEKLFNLMAAAAILQMLAGFDHIFTRMADYYFQFSVLYIPMTFVGVKKEIRRAGMKPIFPFNRRSMKLIALVIVVFVLWFYWTYNINITIDYEVDNYLNYRSMWDVK